MLKAILFRAPLPQFYSNAITILHNLIVNHASNRNVNIHFNCNFIT